MPLASECLPELRTDQSGKSADGTWYMVSSAWATVAVSSTRQGGRRQQPVHQSKLLLHWYSSHGYRTDGYRKTSGRQSSADWSKSAMAGIRLGPLVRERPDPELLFPDLPQPGKPVRLDNQEEDDQCPDDHEGDMLDRLAATSNAENTRNELQEDRQDPDEGCAHEAAHKRPSRPMITMNSTWKEWLISSSSDLSCTEPEEHHHRTCHTADERRHGKCRQLGKKRADAHQFSGDVHVADHHPGPADPAAQDVRHQRHAMPR
jgi:hypothetical protein